MQQHLEYEFAAEIAENEQQCPADDPVHRGPPTPPIAPAAEQQDREDEPSRQREYVLVSERNRLAEDLLRKDDAARQREREQDESRGDQAEQVTLERQQRRRVATLSPESSMQPFFEPRQDKRLQRSDHEQRVCGQRDGDVRSGPRCVGIRKSMRIDP